MGAGAAIEAAVTTNAIPKPMASRKMATTYLRSMARQFAALAPTEAAVTTNAIPKPMVSRKMATTYLFFMVRQVP